MQPIPFIAASAEAAVAQIREKLGPEAVVLNVRQVPSNGLARLWQKPMIEVLAYRPEAVEVAPAPVAAGFSVVTPDADPLAETLAEFRQELNEIKQRVSHRPEKTERRMPVEMPASPEISVPAYVTDTMDLDSGNWRVGAVLQKSGLLPLHTQRVLDQLHMEYGENPPATLGEEIDLAKKVMARFWRQAAPVQNKSLHVLIGPAGSGKTTCLCKWLTQTVLMDGRMARVWRLDSATANTAESLSVYCDILGAPTERMWQPGSQGFSEDLGFIDLPGVDWRKAIAIKELAGHLKQFGAPKIHLVLNGAYDISILLAQVRAFSALPIEDLIVTHLDEETRWGKIWNLVLGTNYSVRCFSTGQNIPGDFCDASAEMIFNRQFPRK